MALTKEREQEIREEIYSNSFFSVPSCYEAAFAKNAIRDLLQEIDELRETAGEQETLKVKRSLFNAKVEAENERDLCRTQLWDAHDKLKAERDNYKGLYEMREKDFHDQCKMLDLNHKGHVELRDKLKEENQKLQKRITFLEEEIQGLTHEGRQGELEQANVRLADESRKLREALELLNTHDIKCPGSECHCMDSRGIIEEALK